MSKIDTIKKPVSDEFMRSVWNLLTYELGPVERVVRILDITADNVETDEDLSQHHDDGFVGRIILDNLVRDGYLKIDGEQVEWTEDASELVQDVVGAGWQRLIDQGVAKA